MPTSTGSSIVDEAFLNTPTSGTKRCWICQQEDSDDTPDNSIWKRPCPCSLTAHDTCLLEWISNEEAPRLGDIARDRRIKCPQCKAELNVQRPRDYIVDTVGVIHRLARGLVYPAAAASALTCTYAGFLVYGINVLKIVFGNEEAQRLLYSQKHPTGVIWSVTRMIASFTESFDPLIPAKQFSSISKVFLGAPLIAPSLVLLRTKWADKAFSFMLPWYFLYPTNHKITWPPSPGLAFATIPYIRKAYNELYRFTFRGLETKWELAVQRKPRAGETVEQIALEAVREEEEEAFFEVRVALGGDENIELQGPAEALPVIPEGLGQVQLQHFPRVHDPIGNIHELDEILQPLAIMDHDALPADIPAPMRDLLEMRNERRDYGNPDQFNIDYNAANNDNGPMQNDFHPEQPGMEQPQPNFPNAHAPDHAHRRPREGGVINDQWPVVHHFSASSLASLVMGALAFPFIAATAGDILKHTLPSSFVASTVTYSLGTKIVKKSILTDKWGRTIVGGCLFVVFKDAVNLYCKWKNAQIFGRRIVMDYVGERKID